MSGTVPVRLSSASKGMQLENDEAAQMKIKNAYPALNNRATYALLDFIKMQYPSIIDTFILNDKVAKSFANVSVKSYYEAYQTLLRKYRNVPGASLFINFYVARYLNEMASFSQSFEDALTSANMKIIREKGVELEHLVDWLIQANIIMNRDAPLYFPTKMREEWPQIHTQLRGKLEAIRLEYASYHNRIHTAQENLRETAERNAAAHTQAAEVSSRRSEGGGRGRGRGGSGKGRATRSRTQRV